MIILKVTKKQGFPISLEDTFFEKTQWRGQIERHHPHPSPSCFRVKRTPMGAKFAVVGSNLVAAYEEIKMFALLPQLYPEDFVDFYIRNYFWILDNVFHKWLENFDIEPFYNMINNLDLDLKLIVKNPSKSLNFLDINLQIVESNIVFDVYYKQANSFHSLTYTSCYPLHTKNNKSLSLAKRIV